MAIVKKETKVVLELTEDEASRVAAALSVFQDPGGTDSVYDQLYQVVSDGYTVEWLEDGSAVEINSMGFTT